MGGGLKMKPVGLTAYIVLGLLAASVTPAHAQNDHMKGMDMPATQSDKASAKSVLKPAEGARVQIVSPKAGQVIKGDSVRSSSSSRREKSANTFMPMST